MGREIYFACPFSDEVVGWDIKKKLAETSKTFGNVLTEHFADPKLKEKQTTKGLTAKQIYDDDMKKLSKSNYVVAEVSQPSLGVGIELGWAIAMRKQILCLYQKDRKLATMIKGASNDSDFVVKDYTDVSEIEGILKTYFSTRPEATS